MQVSGRGTPRGSAPASPEHPHPAAARVSFLPRISAEDALGETHSAFQSRTCPDPGRTAAGAHLGRPRATCAQNFGRNREASPPTAASASGPLFRGPVSLKAARYACPSGVGRSARPAALNELCAYFAIRPSPAHFTARFSALRHEPRTEVTSPASLATLY